MHTLRQRPRGQLQLTQQHVHKPWVQVHQAHEAQASPQVMELNLVLIINCVALPVGMVRVGGVPVTWGHTFLSGFTAVPMMVAAN